ncbi:diguanylate cyclase (GGDEF) domain-containing protein [Halopseudomonas litoralis]|uniref:diguanylate cyclase n=1 Tax=Halopseudomonas litoralis TaxID=797277 RepID=A0A1H1VNB5_9GAMM|nr:GGDEF domain-containing protein [Halopseudomonas litoralis]SDS86398.1 diguanylate cyclase (GGDEF) domain-containing protein [Halopseudomonas litoralis]
MQTDLNTFSLALALVLVTLGMTLVLIMAAWHSGSEKGLRHWALGNLALTMGLVLSISQGLLHYSVSQILAAGLMVLGLGVIWLGVRAFKGLSQPQAGPILAALLVMLVLGYFHYIQDSAAARLAATGICLGGLCLMSARELLVPAAAPLRRAYWFTGGIMLLSGIGLLLRAAAGFQGSLQEAGITGEVLQHATLLGVMVAQIGMAGGFILMTHYRTIMALQQLSEHDALTGTLNRRSMHDKAQGLLDATRQQGLPAALIMVDADHFKRINDEFGHQTGDAVLCHLVTRIRLHMRSNDLLGRFGGEEFVLLLPGVDASDAQEVAERIRLAVNSHTESISDQPVMLSISLGVAGTGLHGYDYTALVSAADGALYRAKALGRNRVEMCSAADSPMRDKMALRLLSQFRHNLDV